MNDSIVNDIMNDLNKPEREKPEIEENKKKNIQLRVHHRIKHQVIGSNSV